MTLPFAMSFAKVSSAVAFGLRRPATVKKRSNCSNKPTFTWPYVDVHMPRLGGLEVIRHLDRQPKSPPYVLMSAQMDEATRHEAIAMHAYEVLDKPIPLSRLTKTVYDALTQVYGWKPA